MVFFCVFWDSTVFLLHCPKNIGTVQHFRPSKCRKRCTVPMFLGPGMQKHCTVPIFELETLKRLVFVSFLGQYGDFASMSQKDWDSTALQALQVVPILLGPVMQKRCTVPIFELETLKRLVFFEFFWTVRCFCFTVPKGLGQYRTSGLPGVPMGLP